MGRVFGICMCLFRLMAYVSGGKYYTSRTDLNETIYGETRLTVTNFIEGRRMNIMERFLRKHKDILFKNVGNSYRLQDFEGEFLTRLFKGGKPPKCFEMARPGCESIADQAIEAFRSAEFVQPDPEVSDYTLAQLLQVIENYVHIRNKMYEYVSEVFNSTMYPAEDNHGVFYYYPPKAPIESNIESVDYLSAPHWDISTFATNSYDRPLVLNTDRLRDTMYRRYSAVLYFTNVPTSDGGNLEYWDLPNYDKLPPAKGTDTGSTIRMGVLRGENATITRVWPRRGKLAVMSATDLHGVTSYTGDFERWGYCLYMTDQKNAELRLQNIVPEQFRPLLESPSARSSHSPHHPHSTHHSHQPDRR